MAHTSAYVSLHSVGAKEFAAEQGDSKVRKILALIAFKQSADIPVSHFLL